MYLSFGVDSCDNVSTLNLQMSQEIDIHRKVNHRHIVGFHGFFEDNDNVYILLELCRRRVSLHKSL